MRLVFKSIKQYTQDSIIHKLVMTASAFDSDDDGDGSASSMRTDEGDEVDTSPNTSPMKIWASQGKGKGHDAARVQHKMACTFKYIVYVVRPKLQAERLEEARARRVQKARWRICALLVREYKNNKQHDMLDKRKELRGERVHYVVELEMWGD